MDTELLSVLSSVKEETDWEFREIIDDLNAGLYGHELVSLFANLLFVIVF
jgi:hypothetical protein